MTTDTATAQFDIEGMDYEIKNNGLHIIITDFQGDKIDFYPSTGTWIPREGIKSSGFNNLIRYIKLRTYHANTI